MGEKVLTIDTVLGEAKNKDMTDQLMLIEVTGQEAISRPFVYDVTMARDPDLRDVVPADMIGTMARIGILQTDSNFYIYRTGMIQNFQKIGKFTEAGGAGNTDILLFKARIVPAFQILAQEIRFRIFEMQTVDKIIKSILEEMSKRSPAFKFNPDKLSSQKFPVMEYCVQFGESTYAFLTRLMHRYGIWFTFDHDGAAGNLPLLMRAENETMVLGKFPSAPDKNCDIHTHTLTDNDPNRDTIANLQRVAEPKLNKIWAGNFNMLNPTKPINATEEIHQSFDLLIERSALAAFSESEEFPGRFQNDEFADEVGGSGQGDTSVKDYVAVREQQQEVGVFSIAGGTKNASLLAGRKIDIVAKQGEFTGDEGEYLLKVVIFNAYEHSYLTSKATDICNFIFRDFLFAPFQKSQGVLDFTVGVVNAGLNNYLQNQQSAMWSKIFYGDDHPPGTSWFLPFFAGGITQAGVTSALSLLVTDIQKIVQANDGKFSTSFVAIPRNPPKDLFRVPAPDPPPRPVAQGPHSAVVIGPDGVDTKNQDFYADAIGRVRVRFPWDPGPPGQGSKLPPPWTSTSHKPYQTGDNTCWVRVSEEWAGHHFGTQFLPRIGQEVLVSFIDGDPERPVLTGRLYNADSGTTNIPFPNKDQKDQQIHKISDLYNTVQNAYRFTGIKTRSTLMPQGAKDRYHLMRLDDMYNCEQYLIRSQGRLDVTAFAHSFETTYGDRHVKVAEGKDQYGNKFGGSAYTTVAGEYDLHIGGNRYEKVDKDYQLTVKGDTSLHLDGDLKVIVGGTASIGANQIVLEATQQISLKVGGSFVVINPCGVYISGPMVYINSGGSATPASQVTILDVADATAAEPGDQYCERVTDCGGGSGGGGQRGSHTYQIQPAPPCTLDAQGMMCVDPLAGGKSTMPPQSPNQSVMPPGPAPGGMSQDPGMSRDPGQGGMSTP